MSLTTGKVRLSFCHVWQPQAPQGGGDPKYSVTILIPKTDTATLNAIYAEMESTKQAGVSSQWGGVLPPIVKIPLYDGDGVRPSGEPFGPECHGHMVMTASCKNQPSVVDTNIQPILNQSEIYSGCYARVNINFFAYNQAGNKGLGCGLNCIQKVGDGEPLAGGVSAQEAFGGSNAYSAMSGAMPASPAAKAYGYQAPVPGMPPVTPQYQTSVPQMPYQAPQAAQQYQMPMQPQQYQQIDPITGNPVMPGGVMGI